MSTFLFYEPRGTTTRFSNKEWFRLRLGAQSHAAVDREPTRISGSTSRRSGGAVDAANTTSWASDHHALPLKSACQPETSPSTSEAADDCFDEAQLSDSDDSLHSLFSDFTVEWPENTGCNSDDVLAMPLQCPQNAIVSPATSHDDANPDDASPNPDEGSGFEHLKPVLDSSPSAVSYGQHARADPGVACPPTPSHRVPSPRSFTDIYSDPADSFETSRNDLAIVDAVQIDAGTQTDQVTAYMDAGTQTDPVDTAQIHSDMQTDQHNVDGSEMDISEPEESHLTG